MAYTPDRARAAAPTDTDVTITVRGFAQPHFVTVLTHHGDGMYVGEHPRMFFVRYVDIESIERGDKTTTR